MMKTTLSCAKRPFPGSLFIALLILPFLAACSGGFNAGNATTASSVTTLSQASSTATQKLHLGPQPCPGKTGNPAYWTSRISPNPGPHHVESVSCANLQGNASLQALVTDHRVNAPYTLDIYVFTKITASKPVLLVSFFGLVKGKAKISGYNSVLTAQADELSALNKGKPISAMTADLFREFSWSVSAGKFVQIVFPGIYPDLTRYQAENDQAQVNQGHQPWKLNAQMVAHNLAVSLLKWSNASSTTLLSGGGPHDVSAVVRVQNTTVIKNAITVTLSRLEGNTHEGIWEAIAVTSSGMSITSPRGASRISSPLEVKGTGNAFEGQVGQVFVLDHLYNVLGQAGAIAARSDGETSFSAKVSYSSTFPAGVQEGLLFLSSPNNASGSIAGAVMLKVLIR